MAVTCPACGARVETEGPAAAACPSCGGALPEDDSGFATRHRDGLDNAARIAGGGGATTFFQPGLMANGDLAAGEDPAGGTAESAPAGVPLPRLDFEAFFLILGAGPGDERIPLARARTTFGRKPADVDLGDAAVSGLHFQIDVMGRERFVRDLDSRNGTFLNGHRVRYSELLPGDELRAGDTVLVFRTSRDGLSRSSPSD